LNVFLAFSAYAEMPVRIAILTGNGDRAADEAALAQLEAALTQEKEITLLERAEVRKILAEQKLSASGLSDPATAVKLGKLLSVEMFLFLERVPGTNPAICRVQLIESLTGLVLAGGLAQENQLDMAQVLSWLRQALEKQRTPLAERRYVGILGLRSEEPGQSLDSLARALGMLLSSDLQVCPGLILLDREHLQWLRQEKDLAAVEQALKSSTVLIEGGIQRSDDKIALILLLNPLVGGEPEKISLRFLPKELEAFRKELVGAIAARFKLKPPNLAMDPAEEGKAFLAQARFLAAADMKDDYLRAAEAAYALWPGRDTRLELAFAYCEQTRSGYYRRALSLSRNSHERFDLATEEEQVSALQFQLQMLTLLCEQFESDYAHDVAVKRSETDRLFHRALYLGPGLGLVTQRAKGQAAALQPEVAALQRKLFDIVAAAAERDPQKYVWNYREAVRGSLDKLALENLRSRNFDCASSQAAGLREVIARWSAGATTRDTQFLSFGRELQLYIGASLQEVGTTKTPPATEARNQFRSAFSEFAHNPNAEVRAVALYGLFTIDDTPAHAEELLKCLRDDIKWDSYGFPDQCYLVETLCNDLAERAVRTLLADKNPALAAAHCEEILGPWMKEGGNPGLVSRSARLCLLWAQAVEETKGKEQAAAVYQRIIAALQDCIKRWPDFEPGAVRRQIRDLEALREKLAIAPPKAPAADDPWNQYEMRPLGLKLKDRVGAVFVHGDRLYCIMSSLLSYQYREGQCLITVSIHKFPEGGPAFRIQTLEVPFQKGIDYGRMWTDMIGDRLFIVVPGGVLTCANDEPLRLLTEADGLPGTIISAMAAYGGNLYLGIGERYGPKHAFAAYDPATRACRFIFSNTAVEPDRRRNTDVQFILADDERKCLWLAGNFRGLCRYVPETDKVDTPLNVGSFVDGPQGGLAFCPGGLFGGCSDLQFVDLQTFKQTLLAKTSGAAWVRTKEVMEGSVFGYLGVHALWPAWYDGATLITYDRSYELGTDTYYLYLFRPGKEPAQRKLFTYLANFTVTPHGLLVTGGKNDGYLIVKKALPDPAATPGDPSKKE
jgi:hypothetical protein